MTARPDPVWTADGMISDRWLPVSPVTEPGWRRLREAGYAMGSQLAHLADAR